jgi:predicted transcriptional regulator
MRKKKSAPRPTAAELELLRVLWPLGSGTVKQVHEAALPARPDLNYATVLRLMQIMHRKGLLKRDDAERSHVYSPAQRQESTRTQLLTDLIQKVFGGSGKNLVVAALRDHVSDEERKEIQRLLDEKE